MEYKFDVTQIRFFENLEQLPYRGDITEEELAQHNKRNDCWSSFQGYVYDFTPYLKVHPGGFVTIIEYAGRDMTIPFMKYHAYVPASFFEKLKIGKLVTKEENTQ